MVAVGEGGSAAGGGCDPLAMAAGSGNGPDTGWAAIRPVLVGFLVAALLFVVVVLALARPQGWWAPFAAFGSLLVGADVL